MSTVAVKNQGWVVVFAGLFINLALGILYSWSIFKDAISDSINRGGEGAFAWKESALNDPYAVCILVFAFTMIIAGRIQDRKGPRITAFIGGILVSVGFSLLYFTNSYAMWVLGFGVLAGIGIGFGYASATPPAFKWFPASKSGLIAGIVVSGFGIAPVYIAPLATFLVKNYGLHSTMLIFGLAFFVVMSACAMLLKNPPAGYVAVETKTPTAKQKAANGSGQDVEASTLFKLPAFYLIWFILFIGSGAGLMVIGSISGMARASLGEQAFLAVAVIAMGNASGRIVAGLLSDKIGRVLTLFILLVFQATLMFMAATFVRENTTAFVIVMFAAFIGFNFGTNLSLFPTFTKVFWGMKNFGMNYGFVLTAWGVGGFVFSRLSQTLFATNGNHQLSFYIAGACLVLCAILAIQLGRMQKRSE
ncbi:MAG: OFA family MFS transporter [Bacteroidetes bacterium]|nr:OFA family MFS transporter [Bacteroidota bacterium]